MSEGYETKDKRNCMEKHHTLVGKGGLGYQFLNHYTYILDLENQVNRYLIVGTRFFTVGVRNYW